MSDIPRYKPVPDDRFGIADDADGKLCEYRHYEQLKSTVQSFAANVLRLGNEVRDLAKERDALKEHIKYLEIELKCETGRWERTMEDNAKLKDENEELHKDYESLADEHTKLIDRNKTLKDELRKRALDSLSDIGQLGEQSAEIASLKAEVERLRASSFVTAVPSEHYERVIKAGDAMAFNYEQMHNIDGVYDSDLMKFVARWNAAKEGNQS